MKVEELFWKPGRSWQTVRGSCGAASLVIYFGSRKAIEDGARRTELRARFPEAIIIGCSTGGQIRGGDVSDEEVVAAAARFEHTRLRVATTLVGDCQGGSIACGQTLGAELAADDLAGVFVLSDGLKVNGSDLVRGIMSKIAPGTPLTGGLAGDGADFNCTVVDASAGPAPNVIGAIGFYGDSIRIGHGSAGGWNIFGPKRVITRSQGNVLFELDGVSEDVARAYLRHAGMKLPVSTTVVARGA